MGLGAGSWSQASCTARLPPWLASAALHHDQVGCPTTEATKRLPSGSGDDAATHDVGERLWAGWISLAGGDHRSLSGMVQVSVGVRFRSCCRWLPSQVHSPPLIRPCPASRGGCPSSLSHRLLVGLQVLAGRPLLAYCKGTGALELQGPLHSGRLGGEHVVDLGLKPRCRRHAQDEWCDQEWCDPAWTEQAVVLQVLRLVAPIELEHLRRVMIPWCCATMIASAQTPDGGIAAVGEGVMGHQ